MARYLVRRFAYLAVLVWLATVVTFVVIQLPPGDYLSTLIARLEQRSGGTLTEDVIEGLRRQYGLDLPMHQRYFKWLGSVLRGDFG